MGALLNLGRLGLYGGAAACSFGLTLQLTQPAKFNGWAAHLDERRRAAQARAVALQTLSPQTEAANALSFAQSEVTGAVRWQTAVAVSMAQAQLEDTRKQIVEAAEDAAEVVAREAAAAAEQAAEATGFAAVSRAEVHVLLPGGDSYEGTALAHAFSLAKDCVPDGYGTMQFISGDRYTGGFRAGSMHGRGHYEAATGEEYVGDYVAGAREGRGSMTDAAGRVVKQGRWSGGEFVGA